MWRREVKGKDFVIVSFITKGFYEKVFMSKLYPTLLKFNLPYDVTLIEKSKGVWGHNVTYKPYVVKQALEKYKDKLVVWIDADATIEEYPTLFESKDIEGKEIGCHLLDLDKWYNTTKYNGKRDLLSGTCFFRYSALDIVEQWLERSIKTPSVWEQRHLYAVLMEIQREVEFYELPLEYCYIATLPTGEEPFVKVDKPIIKHHQASREARRRKDI